MVDIRPNFGSLLQSTSTIEKQQHQQLEYTPSTSNTLLTKSTFQNNEASVHVTLNNHHPLNQETTSENNDLPSSDTFKVVLDEYHLTSSPSSVALTSNPTSYSLQQPSSVFSPASNCSVASALCSAANNSDTLFKSSLISTSPQPTSFMFVSDSDVCAVCLQNEDVIDTVLLPCRHLFHALCILEQVKSKFSCPLCRSNIEQFVPIDTVDGEFGCDSEQHSSGLPIPNNLKYFVDIWENHYLRCSLDFSKIMNRLALNNSSNTFGFTNKLEPDNQQFCNTLCKVYESFPYSSSNTSTRSLCDLFVNQSCNKKLGVNSSPMQSKSFSNLQSLRGFKQNLTLESDVSMERSKYLTVESSKSVKNVSDSFRKCRSSSVLSDECVSASVSISSSSPTNLLLPKNSLEKRLKNCNENKKLIQKNLDSNKKLENFDVNKKQNFDGNSSTTSTSNYLKPLPPSFDDCAGSSRLIYFDMNSTYLENYFEHDFNVELHSIYGKDKWSNEENLYLAPKSANSSFYVLQSDLLDQLDFTNLSTLSLLHSSTFSSNINQSLPSLLPFQFSNSTRFITNTKCSLSFQNYFYDQKSRLQNFLNSNSKNKSKKDLTKTKPIQVSTKSKPSHIKASTKLFEEHDIDHLKAGLVSGSITSLLVHFQSNSGRFVDFKNVHFLQNTSSRQLFLNGSSRSNTHILNSSTNFSKFLVRNNLIGFFDTMHRVAPSIGLYFVIYEYLKDNFNQQSSSSFSRFFNWMSAAAISAQIGHMLVDRSKLIPLRYAIQFAVFEQAKHMFLERQSLNSSSHVQSCVNNRRSAIHSLSPFEVVASAIIGGVAAHSFIYPLSNTSQSYTNLSTLRSYFKQQRFNRLYCGFGRSTLRFLPVCVLTATTYEFALRYIVGNN